MSGHIFQNSSFCFVGWIKNQVEIAEKKFTIQNQLKKVGKIFICFQGTVAFICKFMITSYNSYKGVYTILLISDLLTFFPMQKFIPDLEFPSNCYVSVVFEAVLHCYNCFILSRKKSWQERKWRFGPFIYQSKKQLNSCLERQNACAYITCF